MLKNLGKIVFKSVIFIALFFGIIKLLEPIFTESKTSVWANFYAQQKNTVDVLILGNSHSNTGINREIIEAKLNSKVVSLATKGQNIYQSYYCALEAYNYQTPEVLIIENYLFYERLTKEEFITLDPQINDYMKRYISFEGKKIGKVKYEESKAFFNGSFLENMFATIKKHDRWTDIKKIRNRLYEANLKKGNAGITVMDFKKVQQYKDKKKYDLDTFDIMPDEEKALNDIVELAKEKGTKQVILLTIPFYKTYREQIDYNSLEKPLKQYVQKNKNVTYVDLNSVYPNLDYSYFSNDPVGSNQHLNYKGAIIVSNYLTNNVIDLKNKSKINKNKSLIEYYLYNKIKKDTLLAGNRIKGNLEKINKSKDAKYTITQGESAVRFDGWMAIEDMRSEGNEMFIGLVKDENFVYLSSSYQLKNIIRKDVTTYFEKENKLYDNSGFHVNINSLLLQKGSYKIFMIIKNKDGEVLIKDSRKRLEIK